MPQLPLPGIEEVVICGLVTWAINALVANSHIGAPIRRLGQRALMWKGVLWWISAPLRAAALCFFCLSWWSAGLVAAGAVAYTASPWYAVLIPTGVAITTLFEKIVAAPRQSPEDLLRTKLAPPPPPPDGVPPPPFRL
jgi:hypothetical protein